MSSIAGDVTVDELMSKLLNDHEVFTQQQFKDIQEEVCIYSLPVFTTIVHDAEHKFIILQLNNIGNNK